MGLSGDLNLAFQKVENEIKKGEQLLSADKTKLEHDKQEIETLTDANKKAKVVIAANENIIRKDESEVRHLEPEIHELERQQQKDHMEISRLEQEDRERLKDHGVKIPPLRHY